MVSFMRNDSDQYSTVHGLLNVCIFCHLFREGWSFTAGIETSIEMQRIVESCSTKCSSCLKDFHVPRLLPCGHTFCTPCLQQLVNHYTSVHKIFRCPLCGNDVTVPPGGADGFPGDVKMVLALANRGILQVGLTMSERS